MKNRFPITVRFSVEEQRDIASMMRFYNIKDPKQLLKLAYKQFTLATQQLTQKLEAEQEKANALPNDNDRVSSVDAGDSGSSEVVHADSGSGDGSVPTADADAAG